MGLLLGLVEASRDCTIVTYYTDVDKHLHTGKEEDGLQALHVPNEYPKKNM